MCVFVGSDDVLAKRQQCVLQTTMIATIRVASEIKGESIAFATKARSIYIRGLPLPKNNPLYWTFPSAESSGASCGTVGASNTSNSPGDPGSSTSTAPRGVKLALIASRDVKMLFRTGWTPPCLERTRLS